MSHKLSVTFMGRVTDPGQDCYLQYCMGTKVKDTPETCSPCIYSEDTRCHTNTCIQYYGLDAVGALSYSVTDALTLLYRYIH